MQAKYAKDVPMGCGCSGGNNTPIMESRSPEMLSQDQVRRVDSMSDDDFLMCTYTHPNLGEHRVIGPATGKDYGFRGGGNKFIVHKADIAVSPELFSPEMTSPAILVQDMQPIEYRPIEDEAPPENLRTISGITEPAKEPEPAKKVAFGGEIKKAKAPRTKKPRASRMK
jgi:hypothetical protein